MVLLIMAVLIVIGIMGLVKKQLKVSGNKVLSGMPLKLFSIFYLAMAVERFLVGIDFWIFSLIILASIIVMLFIAKPAKQ